MAFVCIFSCRLAKIRGKTWDRQQCRPKAGLRITFSDRHGSDDFICTCTATLAAHAIGHCILQLSGPDRWMWLVERKGTPLVRCEDALKWSKTGKPVADSIQAGGQEVLTGLKLASLNLGRVIRR